MLIIEKGLWLLIQNLKKKNFNYYPSEIKILQYSNEFNRMFVVCLMIQEMALLQFITSLIHSMIQDSRYKKSKNGEKNSQHG